MRFKGRAIKYLVVAVLLIFLDFEVLILPPPRCARPRHPTPKGPLEVGCWWWRGFFLIFWAQGWRAQSLISRYFSAKFSLFSLDFYASTPFVPNIDLRFYVFTHFVPKKGVAILDFGFFLNFQALHRQRAILVSGGFQC